MLAEMRRRGHAALDEFFEWVAVFVALSDSPLCMYALGAGEPSCIDASDSCEASRAWFPSFMQMFQC